MEFVESALTRFVRSFEHNDTSTGASNIRNQFAEQFLVLSPQGAQYIRAEDFAAALPRRKAFFKSAGVQSSELIGLEESTLGDRYVLAKRDGGSKLTPKWPIPMRLKWIQAS